MGRISLDPLTGHHTTPTRQVYHIYSDKVLKDHARYIVGLIELLF